MRSGGNSHPHHHLETQLGPYPNQLQVRAQTITHTHTQTLVHFSDGEAVSFPFLEKVVVTLFITQHESSLSRSISLSLSTQVNVWQPCLLPLFACRSIHICVSLACVGVR